jgi:hypothetical protein
LSLVVAGHSRSKNGVASLAYVPAIHALLDDTLQDDVDARDMRGHDAEVVAIPSRREPLYSAM